MGIYKKAHLFKVALRVYNRINRRAEFRYLNRYDRQKDIVIIWVNFAIHIGIIDGL